MAEDNLDGDLRDLIFRYFYRFSRFEFALKKAGCLRDHSPGARADPGWPDFIDQYHAGYELSEAAKGLIAANPKREVVGPDGLSLAFIDVGAGANELDHLVTLARTVRNNLFHGGKYDSEGWDNPVRVRTLVEPSIRVLDELADRAGLNGDYTGHY